MATNDARIPDDSRRVEALAPWLTGLLFASLVLVSYYPPMTDLPFHEAAIGILRHFGDTTMFPTGLYLHNLGEPNQLFHMLGWALSYIVSTRWAVKLVVAAAVLAVPVSAARFARHVGASPLAALVVAPMALGWLFSWGLVANLLGLSAFLLMLPALDRLAQEPTPRRTLVALGGVALLYFAHEAMMILYGGAALALAVLHPLQRGSWKKSAWRLTPFAASLALAVAQARWQVRFMTPAVRAMPRLWHPLLHKLERIPYIILPASDPFVDTCMTILCVLAIATFLWLRTRERRASAKGAATATAGPSSRLAPARAWALAHRWEVFSAACFAAYLSFPLTLNGATLVYQRWFPPAFAVFAVVAAPRNLSIAAARVTRLVCYVLPMATVFVAWPSFADSSNEYEALDQILPRIEPGSAVAEIDLGPGDPSRTYSLGPAAGRVLATRGGRLAYAFTDSSVSPVVLARRYQWNESLIRIGFDSWAFVPQHDLRRFRYMLVRTTDPALAWVASYVLLAEADYVGEAGEWILFQSKLPVVPLTSHDVALESPPQESVRDRVNQMMATLREPPKVKVPMAPEPANEPHF